MPRNPLEKNIFYFYIARLFWLPFFWMPVMLMYLVQNKGFSPVEAYILVSVQEASLIFLEIPTGVIADRISRKFSVALGYVVTALPFVFMPWVNSFWLVFLLFFFKAIGKALMSGAQQALLYDTLAELGRTLEYKYIMTKTKVLTLVLASFTFLAGGLLAQWGLIEWTMILPFPFMLLGGIATYMSIEPAVSVNAKKLQETTYLRHAFEASKSLLRSPYLLLIALVFAVNDATQVNLKWFYTPIFEDLGFNFALIGGTTAFLYLVKGLLSGVSLPMMSKSALSNIKSYMPVVSGGFLLLALYFQPILVVLALLVVNLGTELLDTSIEEELNGAMGSRDRATTMSIVALMGSVLATIMLWVFGVLKVYTGIQGAVLFVASLFIFGTYLTYKAEKIRQVEKQSAMP